MTEIILFIIAILLLRSICLPLAAWLNGINKKLKEFNEKKEK